MGHWAKVENYVNNVGDVTDIVHVTDAADVAAGKLSGSPSDWIQCSYNISGGVHYVPDATGTNSFKTPSDNQSTVIAAQDGRQRKNYPGVGYKYDRTRDMFYEAQRYASWTLNESTGFWEPPIAFPTVMDDGQDPVVFIWEQTWNETLYQSDNSKGWIASRSNDTSDPKTVYDWNGSAWISR